MPHAVASVKEERQLAFERAKEGIDPAIVDRIMKGLPVPGDSSGRLLVLRQAWAAYRDCL
jgi:hypothetical protein